LRFALLLDRLRALAYPLVIALTQSIRNKRKDVVDANTEEDVLCLLLESQCSVDLPALPWGLLFTTAYSEGRLMVSRPELTPLPNPGKAA
jgi:hypothetical protein